MNMQNPVRTTRRGYLSNDFHWFRFLM